MSAGQTIDVIVVGGGPAGLSAALFLGRCRRTVMVLDAGRPRNARSRWVSGFLTRDGTEPDKLRAEGRAELRRYPSVSVRDGIEVASAKPRGDGFDVVLDCGERLRSRKLVIATGLMHDVPDFPGSRTFFGRGVYPCPYCDGWEHQDEPLIAYGRGRDGLGMALELLTWSRHVVLVTHGPSELALEDRRRLRNHRIEVVEEEISGLHGDPDGEGLEAIVFRNGLRLETRALFYTFEGCRPSPLVHELGCDLAYKGAVDTGYCEKTNVPGLYVVGDASRRVKFAIVAAAEGAMAAFAIHNELHEEDLDGERARAEEAA